MHHSSNDIPIQWVKNFLHAMTEIYATLDSVFCIHKATKWIILLPIVAVFHLLLFLLAVAEQVGDILLLFLFASEKYI